MERREFLRRMTLGLAAGWLGGRWCWPSPAQAEPPRLRLALLADAHLRDGDASCLEARALARAVAEIRRLRPAPDLVLFAGDLAHDGNPRALALGREILGDLPGTLAAVRGEGDATGKGAAAWTRLFGESRFSRSYPGFHLLGLHTSPTTSPQGPVFEVGQEQRGWLAGELARLDPATPLVVLSHAPLYKIFRPWGQWTRDGVRVMGLLSKFPQIYCFHGHVHRVADSFQPSAFSQDLTGPDDLFLTENRKPKTENHPLPALAWPLPSPLQGTPAAPGPGQGPGGCGWGLVSLGGKSLNYQPQLWQA
ncbi:MAG: metallophosphoesterase [Thermodesulfobacteriota bacterium]